MPPFGSPAVLSYLGAFTFAPGSLVTGNSNNGYVTIASLRNGNAGVVTVQYRRSSAAATTGTLRLTLNGANVGTYTGLTVAGTHKINLVFSSGSRLTLSVDDTVAASRVRRMPSRRAPGSPRHDSGIWARSALSTWQARRPSAPIPPNRFTAP